MALTYLGKVLITGSTCKNIRSYFRGMRTKTLCLKLEASVPVNVYCASSR